MSMKLAHRAAETASRYFNGVGGGNDCASVLTECAVELRRLADENTNLNAACKIADRRNAELLEALRMFIDFTDGNSGPSLSFDKINEARALIAEAEGREP